MSDFLTEAECVPNLNSATIAGQLKDWKPVKISKPDGMITALSFRVAYQKTWPNGSTQEIEITCYVTGEERIKKLGWLNHPDEFVLVRGEVTNKGAVYAHQVEWLSKPARERGEDDAYLAGVAARHPGGDGSLAHAHLSPLPRALHAPEAALFLVFAVVPQDRLHGSPGAALHGG